MKLGFMVHISKIVSTPSKPSRNQGWRGYFSREGGDEPTGRALRIPQTKLQENRNAKKQASLAACLLNL
jgi:hypothetical protein